MKQPSLLNRNSEIGQAMPEAVFGPITTEMLARWTAAADDYNPIHYDQRFALAQGLPDVIMHGPYKLSLMIRYFEEWAGQVGYVRHIKCRYSAMDVPGDTLTFRAIIVAKRDDEDGAKLAECEWEAVNQKGVKTLEGHAVLQLEAHS